MSYGVIKFPNNSHNKWIMRNAHNLKLNDIGLGKKDENIWR